MTRRRIGILTGGGDCSGLNAVIRGVTKLALATGDFEVVGFLDGYRGLTVGDYTMLEDATVSNLLDRGGTMLGSSNKSNPYQWYDEDKDGKVTVSDRSADAVNVFKEMNLEALVVVGGDGTFAMGHKLQQDGIRIVGIPKTIDNDLKGTDLTVGFATAVDTVTRVCQRLKSTAESHHRIMIAEIMGRYAGWLALSGGSAVGADAILLPEIPYDIGKVAAGIRNRVERGKRYSIIIVSEGATPVGGGLFVRKMIKDSPEQIRLGGVGLKIADEIEDILDIPSRATILGHIQRGGEPVYEDRLFASRLSIEAFKRIKEGHAGFLLGLQGGEIRESSLDRAASGPRKVPADHHLIQFERGIGTIFGD